VRAAERQAGDEKELRVLAVWREMERLEAEENGEGVDE
jgi:hypothetical protein